MILQQVNSFSYKDEGSQICQKKKPFKILLRTQRYVRNENFLYHNLLITHINLTFMFK